MGALWLGRGHHGRLHRHRVPDGPDLLRDEHRDGLRARRDDRGPAARPRAGHLHRDRERGGLRFLLRAAALHVPGERRAVPHHLPRDAGRHAHHRQPDGERAAAEPRRRRARAAHRAAVRDEPRTGGDAWQRQHGAGRGQARGGGVRLDGCRADAGRDRAPALSGRHVRSRARSAAPTSRWRSGSSTTASAPDSARTRCRPRRPSTCRSRGAARSLGVLGVLPANRRRVLLPEQRRLLETFAGQIALALERAALGEEAATLAHRRRDREPAQHAAGVDLARPAHAARGHHRRRQHAGPSRRHAWMRRHAQSLARVDRRTGARDVQPDLQRAGPDAPRVRPGRAAAATRTPSKTSSEPR